MELPIVHNGSSNRSFFLSAAIAVTGIIATGVLFSVAYRSESSSYASSFQHDADMRASGIATYFERQEHELDEISRLYHPNDVLDHALKNTRNLDLITNLSERTERPKENAFAVWNPGAAADTESALLSTLRSLLFPLIERNEALSVAGSSWNLMIKATPEYRRTNSSLLFAAILPLGLTVTLLLVLWARREQLHLITSENSRLRYFELYDSAPVGYVTLSETFLIKEANQAAATMFGETRTDLINKPLITFIHDENEPVYDRHVAQLVETGENQAWNMRFLRADGSSFQARILIGTARGNLYRIILEDITETVLMEMDLKQSHDTLHAQELFSHSTLDGLNSHICVIDESGIIVTTNRAWNEFAEHNGSCSKACCVGANYLETCRRVHPLNTTHDAESFVDGITAVMNGTLPEFIKEYSCHSPESQQWFCCKVNSFKTDNRKYAVISHENITWRKLAESELCKLSKAVEQSPIAIIITDSDGKIEYVNPKFSDYTGYSAEEAVSGYPSLLKSGITPDDVYRDLWTSISAGKSWSGEMYNKRKDGTLYWEHALIAPFMDEDGESTHYIAFKEDITEKKDLTDQLNHAQRVESIGQLAGGLAHDLNNILSVINGYATLLKINQRMDQTSCDQVNEILSASARAGELTRSMLAYSRKQIMNKKALDLNPLLATIGTFITRIIGENITLTTTIHAYPLMVNADAVQIEQVLLNLATNARDAMPTGGSFTVETSVVNVHESTISNQLQGKTGRYACITIADTGKGMNEVTLKRIYDPFYTTKGIGKGSGLGMSMVHGIVTQHDGLIDLTSSVGCGTTFRIYLPLITEDEAESTDVEPIHHFERGTETILFVEDDQNTLDVTVEFLTRAGYTVLVAMNGQEAVDTFSANRDQISVVISDVVMPVKSGKEACDEILEIAPDTPYLFVSGHAYDIIENQGELGRGAELIMKPILPFVLLSKIRELIG